MDEWLTYKTSELIRDGVLEIGDGYRAKNSEMSSTGLPFIRAGNVNGGVNTKGCDLLGFESVARVGNKRSRIGDVVLTTKGTVGRLGFVTASTDEFVYSPQLCFWRSLNPELIEPRFIYFALQSKELKHQMGWSAGQTDMAPYISLTDQRTSFTISFPDIEEQRAIASILGALDDKIDLNRRMNETLEAMARAIFKSWFVNFDPVRAKAEGRQPPGLDPEIAALFPDALDDDDKPVGWHWRRIGSLGKVVTGKTPTTKDAENFDGPYPFITIPDLDGRMFIDNATRTLSEKGAQTVRGSLLPAGAVMMSCIATVGRTGITTRASVTNQQINSVICNDDVDSRYLYWTFRDLRHDIEQAGGGGSVYTNVSKSRFSNIEVLVPPLKIQSAFAGPWFEMLKANVEQSQTLAQLRDLLLPKLMSSKIRLKDAEKAIEEVA